MPLRGLRRPDCIALSIMSSSSMVTGALSFRRYVPMQPSMDLSMSTEASGSSALSSKRLRRRRPVSVGEMWSFHNQSPAGGPSRTGRVETGEKPPTAAVSPAACCIATARAVCPVEFHAVAAAAHKDENK